MLIPANFLGSLIWFRVGFRGVLGFVFVYRNLIVLISRSRAPGDKARPEAREAKDRPGVAAVGVHFEEPEATVILQAEDDPAPVGRVGAGKGLDVPALELRQEAEARSGWTDGGDVCRVRGRKVGIVGEEEAPTVRRPVLFQGDIEGERRDLKEVPAVDVDGEKCLPDIEPVEVDKAECPAIGRNARVGHAAACPYRDELPMAAIEP